jgi:FkbM family methyltransferase
MKEVLGIWIPDHDGHFAAQIKGGPRVDGKGTYQFKKYLAALRFVKGHGHAVDVGAHIGTWSRVMAIDFDHVTAIEPVAEHRECFALNAPDRTTMLPYALGAAPGTIRIDARPTDNSGNARVSDDGEGVEVVTLDSLGLLNIDLLKIDVEGYEYEVLLGGEQTIRAQKPVMVVEQKPAQAERYGRGRWDAVSLLKSWGMKQKEEIGGDHIMVF